MKPKTNDPICDALDIILQLDALDDLYELVRRGRGARHSSEAAAVLERDAVVHDRASEGFAEHKRYDLAAGERERAARLREIAAAVRTLDAHREQLRSSAEQPPLAVAGKDAPCD